MRRPPKGQKRPSYRKGESLRWTDTIHGIGNDVDAVAQWCLFINLLSTLIEVSRQVSPSQFLFDNYVLFTFWGVLGTEKWIRVTFGSVTLAFWKIPSKQPNLYTTYLRSGNTIRLVTLLFCSITITLGLLFLAEFCCLVKVGLRFYQFTVHSKGQLISKCPFAWCLQVSQKTSMKPPGSYKKTQGRNLEIISLVFLSKRWKQKDILKLTDL